MKVNAYLKVKSLEEAYKLLKQSSQNRIIAGGLMLKKENINADTLIDISSLGLDKIKDHKEYIEVGAMVTQRDLEKSELVPEIIKKVTKSIMGPAFRELATVGGSIYGKFGFSDLITIFLTYKVELVFYPDAIISLDEYLEKPGFYDGILSKIRIYKDEGKVFFKKVARTAIEYPILNIAIKKSKEYKIVIGSRPFVASTCKDAMKYLNDAGKDFEKAAEIATNELKFGDTVFAKSGYRKHLAQTYIKRGLEEVSK